MSRRAKRERHVTRGGTGTAPPVAPASGRRFPRARAAVVVLVLAAAGASWLAWHRHSGGAGAVRATLPVPALLDSVKVAEKAQDWMRLRHWLQRLRDADPGNSSTQLALAMTEHNLAWMGTPYGRARSATRTSLDRIENQKRVLAMIDSSSARARTPREWARAQYWAGRVYENLGLTTDALRIYTNVLMQAPGVTSATANATSLLQYLRDPEPPPVPETRPSPAAIEPLAP